MANEPMDTASFGGDVEPLLPDGWDGVSDIFADAKVVNEQIEGADEYREDNALDELLNEGEEAGEQQATEEVPTTDEEPVAAPEPTAAPRTLKLKVNHQEQEVNLDEMSDEDIISLFQKGYAFDAVKDKERRETYDRVYHEELDAGMTDRQARYAAEREAGGDYSQPAISEETKQPEAQSAAPSASPARDMAEELRQLRVVRPNVDSIPDAVIKYASQGLNLTQAYMAWESDANSKTAASLKRENEVLKQNAASAARAPVTGVTGGGATTGKAMSQFEQQFLKGFDEGSSW